MALNADALTTVAKVRRKKSMRKIDDEEWIEDEINTYSRAIRHYTGREWAPKLPGGSPETTLLERRFLWDGSTSLSLEPFEAREIQELKLYAGTLAAQTIAAKHWRAGPSHKTDEGTYLYLTLRHVDLLELTTHPDDLLGEIWEVGVSGRWGATAIPPDVSKACDIAVANAILNPEGFASRRLGELDVAEVIESEEGLSLPRDARNLLIPYRRQRARMRRPPRTTA